MTLSKIGSQFNDAQIPSRWEGCRKHKKKKRKCWTEAQDNAKRAKEKKKCADTAAAAKKELGRDCSISCKSLVISGRTAVGQPEAFLLVQRRQQRQTGQQHQGLLLQQLLLLPL